MPAAPHHHGHRARAVRVLLRHVNQFAHRTPVVRRGREPPLLHDLPVPSLQLVLRIPHQRVLDLTERRVVLVERQQPRLQLQRELLRQLSRRRHQTLLVLHERRLALVQVLRVASPAPDQTRRAVVGDVVRAFAERLYLEVAAAVPDEQPRVDLLAQYPGTADLDELAHAGNRPYLPLHLLPDRGGAVLHHVLDAALVEPAHDVVVREQEPERERPEDRRTWANDETPIPTGRLDAFLDNKPEPVLPY